MKKYVFILVSIKLWLILVVATLLPAGSGLDIQRSALAGSATPTPVPEDKTTRQTSQPFTGDLSIFDDPERAARLQVDRVMDVLRINEGRSAADIGAGSGWFTVHAARRVGERGTVFAVDINPASADHINRRAVTEGLKNIRVILSKADDPLLPAGSVDAVLILKTYHEFAEPVALMKRVRTAMRKGGLVGIIDRTGDGADHGIDEATIMGEMKRAGFRFKERHDFVKGDEMDYFLVFQVE